MAVETTTAFSGPYNANGATTTFGFTFIAKAADEIGVLLRDSDGVDSVVSTSAYTVTLNANGTGSVVFTTAPASGNSVYIYSDVSFQHSIDFEDGTGWKASPVNEVSDRAALRDIYLKNKADRSLVVPYGEAGFTLPTAIERQGLYLAFDADGDPVVSSGTGADAGLRTDLAATSGSLLIGSGTGATVEARLDSLDSSASGLSAEVDAAQSQITALEAATSRLQRMYPPFTEVAGVYVADVVPTAANPMAAKRLHADWFLVRVRSSTLAAVSLDDVYWDEYYFRNPRGYSEVDSGWQLVGWRAYYNSRYSTWLTSPDSAGGIPNADFALRLGLYSSSYHSGGEGPSYYFSGFGHGRAFANDAAVSIIKDGGGSNLNPTAAWPVGTTLLGYSFDVTTAFKLRALTATLGSNPIATTNGSGTVTITHTGHGYSTGQWVKLEGVPFAGVNGITYAQLIARQQVTVVDANSYTLATGGTATSTGSGGGSSVQVFADVVDLTFTQSMGTQGLRRKGAYSASLAGYAIQDSYGYMFPVNSYEVTHFKPSDTTAIVLAQDSAQKGNWTGSSNSSLYHQAYNSARPTIIAQMYLEYGQPLRKALGGLSAWAQNNYGRYFFRDLPDYAKYYVFINSSEEGLPRTAWPMTVGEVYEWQSLLRTEYRAGGPR